MPVSIVHSLDDSRCPTEMAEWFYAQIMSSDKHIRFEMGDHYLFSYAALSPWTDRIVQTIETGSAKPGAWDFIKTRLAGIQSKI